MSQVMTLPAPADVTDMDPALKTGLTSRNVRLAALPSSVPWARRVLRHLLREWQLESMSDPALLLVSELVTNAVQASERCGCLDDPGHQMVALTLELSDTSLLMKVWDANPGLPVLREADVTGDRGRGLLLVDFLADAWGHYEADHGKVVWCELGIQGACAAGLADQVPLPGPRPG
jgi:anti-sigma regulatory factor (Ser/Thr protein kinase)